MFYDSSIKKPEKKELVIPLIRQNRWRMPAMPKTAEDGTPAVQSEASQLEDLAAQEIIQETQKANEGWESKLTGVPANIEIPLFMQNRVPSGFETDEKVDVSLRADAVRHSLINPPNDQLIFSFLVPVHP